MNILIFNELFCKKHESVHDSPSPLYNQGNCNGYEYERSMIELCLLMGMAAKMV